MIVRRGLRWWRFLLDSARLKPRGPRAAAVANDPTSHLFRPAGPQPDLTSGLRAAIDCLRRLADDGVALSDATALRTADRHLRGALAAAPRAEFPDALWWWRRSVEREIALLEQLAAEWRGSTAHDDRVAQQRLARWREEKIRKRIGGIKRCLRYPRVIDRDRQASWKNLF
jgi:hypothetical protein